MLKTILASALEAGTSKIPSRNALVRGHIKVALCNGPVGIRDIGVIVLGNSRG